MDQIGGFSKFAKQFASENVISDLHSIDLARKLDEKDDLGHLRGQFHFPKMATMPEADQTLVNPEEDAIYLCGNSLGLMPKATKDFIDQELVKWANMGVYGHHSGALPWIDSDESTLPGLQKLVGAEEGEVASMNGLTVNLHILLTSFYTPSSRRHKILLENQAFPSDHYAIESQIRLKGFDPKESMVCLKPREGEDVFRTEDIIDYINQHGDEIAVILFSGVQYYSGQLFDIEAITKAGQNKSCIVGWDLAHAFANVPLSLHQWNVDFACWCSYKYGSSGAGGLAGAFIHNKYKDDKRERMLGWWSHNIKTRFQMSNELDLAEGAAGYRISNPPIMLVCGVMGFLKAIESTDINQLREKSLKLTGYMESLIHQHFPEENNQKAVKISLITPEDPKQRGCQLSLKFNCDIALIYKELAKRGCAVDKRYPNVIRVAAVHLYNSFEDCWRFVKVLEESVQKLNELHLLSL